jgi:hypothetical protein
MMGRLGAEGAVLRTAARLGIDDGAQEDPATEMAMPDTRGTEKEGLDFGPFSFGETQDRIFLQGAAGKDLLRYFMDELEHGVTSGSCE